MSRCVRLLLVGSLLAGTAPVALADASVPPVVTVASADRDPLVLPPFGDQPRSAPTYANYRAHELDRRRRPAPDGRFVRAHVELAALLGVELEVNQVKRDTRTWVLAGTAEPQEIPPDPTFEQLTALLEKFAALLVDPTPSRSPPDVSRAPLDDVDAFALLDAGREAWLAGDRSPERALDLAHGLISLLSTTRDRQGATAAVQAQAWGLLAFARATGRRSLPLEAEFARQLGYVGEAEALAAPLPFDHPVSIVVRSLTDPRLVWPDRASPGDYLAHFRASARLHAGWPDDRDFRRNPLESGARATLSRAFEYGDPDIDTALAAAELAALRQRARQLAAATRSPLPPEKAFDGRAMMKLIRQPRPGPFDQDLEARVHLSRWIDAARNVLVFGNSRATQPVRQHFFAEANIDDSPALAAMLHDADFLAGYTPDRSRYQTRLKDAASDAADFVVRLEWIERDSKERGDWDFEWLLGHILPVLDGRPSHQAALARSLRQHSIDANWIDATAAAEERHGPACFAAAAKERRARDLDALVRRFSDPEQPTRCTARAAATYLQLDPKPPPALHAALGRALAHASIKEFPVIFDALPYPRDPTFVVALLEPWLKLHETQQVFEVLGVTRRLLHALRQLKRFDEVRARLVLVEQLFPAEGAAERFLLALAEGSIPPAPTDEPGRAKEKWLEAEWKLLLAWLRGDLPLATTLALRARPLPVDEFLLVFESLPTARGLAAVESLAKAPKLDRQWLLGFAKQLVERGAPQFAKPLFLQSVKPASDEPSGIPVVSWNVVPAFQGLRAADGEAAALRWLRALPKMPPGEQGFLVQHAVRSAEPLAALVLATDDPNDATCRPLLALLRTLPGFDSDRGRILSACAQHPRLTPDERKWLLGGPLPPPASEGVLAPAESVVAFLRAYEHLEHSRTSEAALLLTALATDEGPYSGPARVLLAPAFDGPDPLLDLQRRFDATHPKPAAAKPPAKKP